MVTIGRREGCCRCRRDGSLMLLLLIVWLGLILCERHDFIE